MKSDRREFVKGALAIGGAVLARPARAAESAAAPSPPEAADPAVGKPFAGWQPGRFQLHMIYTGVCESMFLIYPDGTSMLLDCGDHGAIDRGELAVPVLPSGNRRAGEWIARYVQRVNPAKTTVDYMVLSHFHSDHSGCMAYHAGFRGDVPLSGFGHAMEWLTFKRAVDRGYPDYSEPFPFFSGERLGSRDLMDRVYRTLKKRDGLKVEKARLGATDQYPPLKDPSLCAGFEIKNVAVNGKVALPDGTVRNVLDGYPREKWPHIIGENGLSICQLITYGKFKLLTTGDYSEVLPTPDGKGHRIEDDLADAVPHVDVAKIPHHGHNSTSEKLAAALSPRVWLSGVWDQLHNTADTMERIDGAYSGDRLYCPGIMPAERRWQDKDAPWMKNVAPECYKGTHVVVDVEKGGDAYSVFFIAASSESMKVKGVRHFRAG